MITFIRHLIAVPLKLLLWVCGFVPIFDKLSLMEKIFFLTGEADDGSKVIFMTGQKLGIESARAKAEKILERCRSAKISYAIAVLEINNNHDCIDAEKWIQSAEQNNYADMHFLYGLELILSRVFEDYNHGHILDKMLKCNYLQPNDSRMALLSKQDMLLGEQQWAEAEEIADRMLSIKEDAEASIAKWVVCRAREDYAQANEHLADAGRKLPEGTFNVLVIEGYLMYLKDEQKAMEQLCRAVKSGCDFKTMPADSSVGELLRSERFKEYCAEKV